MGNVCVTKNGRQVDSNPGCQDPALADQRIWIITLVNVVLWLVWRALSREELGNGKYKMYISFVGAMICYLLVSLAPPNVE